MTSKMANALYPAAIHASGGLLPSYALLLTFSEEFLSGSTTTFTLNGGLKSYVLLQASQASSQQAKSWPWPVMPCISGL